MSVTRRQLTAIAAIAFPLAVATSIAWIQSQSVRWIDVEEGTLWVSGPGLEAIHVETAAELIQFYRRVGYEVLPAYGTAVPRHAIFALPRDLDQLESGERKSVFFRALLPIVLAENEQIRDQRQQLLRLLSQPFVRWSPRDIDWILSLKERYRVDGSIGSSATRAELLARVDELPPALVLAQAANESGWGSSRFAKLGNNLFGLWTYDESQGIVPMGRVPGQKHAVQVFPDVRAAVGAYFQTLNSHAAYAELRQVRKRLRDANLPLDARAMAGGLRKYSSRGDAYVEAIRTLIDRYELVRLRHSTLRSSLEPVASAG